MKQIADGGVPSSEEEDLSSEIDRRKHDRGTDYKWRHPGIGALLGGGAGLVAGAGEGAPGAGAATGAVIGGGLGGLYGVADQADRERLSEKFQGDEMEGLQQKYQDEKQKRRERFQNMMSAKAEV